jgi:copper chaperone NosL
MTRASLALLAALLLLGPVGCKKKESAALPPPQDVSATAQAQFCGMTLAEHPGPKGQIFLRGDTHPLWFASVRDTFAFTLLPEMPKNIAAVYVNDMGRARNWDAPEAGTWVEAHDAAYVIGSRKRAGMETDEAVPFGDRQAAQRFAAENGGRVVGYDDMPRDYIFPDARSGS